MDTQFGLLIVLQLAIPLKKYKKGYEMIHGFEKLSYTERLWKCDLPTLKYKRIRGDMIERYKIKTASPELKLNVSTKTRGNKYKLDTYRTKYDLRKYFFTNRIINIWNSLTDYVVMSKTVNQFKNQLDKFLANQELL